jgi:hypothetical protein
MTDAKGAAADNQKNLGRLLLDLSSKEGSQFVILFVVSKKVRHIIVVAAVLTK